MLREETNLGLAEAKQLLESTAAGVRQTTISQGEPLPQEVLAELARGNKLQAIKVLRKASGLGLKEAKELVEAAEAGTPGMRSRLSTGLAHGEAPGGALRTILVVVVMLAVGGALWLLFK